MVVEAGYTQDDLDSFQNTADLLGVNYVDIADKEQMIDYINNKDGGLTRADDQITYMSFFSHGQSEKYTEGVHNQLAFAYDIENVDQDAINFTQSDIARLDSGAFLETTTWFYSCNAGTKDGNGMSFAQTWSNKTGGTSYGIENGRTLYAVINRAAPFPFYVSGHYIAPMEVWHCVKKTDLWNEKEKRSEGRDERGYSIYGSLNYLWVSSLFGDLDVLNPFNFGLLDRGWKEFTTESCVEE